MSLLQRMIIKRSGILRRFAPLLGAWVLILALGLASTAAAAPGKSYPDVIPLPDGFRPEGIAVGHGHTFFVGSIPTGAIFRGDLRSGEGQVLVPTQEGRAAIGLDVDERTNYVYAAGGPTGKLFVYDGDSGANVASFTLTKQSTFVNDVIVTRSAAYLTDSFRPFLYKVPLSAGGELPDASAVEEIELGGDFAFIPGAFNANGIDATPNGKWLVVVNSTVGALYLVDPDTGVADQIDLGGEVVTAGDGILLDGKTLYVVRNQLNQIAVVELAPDLSWGEIVRTITDPDFRVPTTIDEFGSHLYAVNARFGVQNPNTAEYEVVRVPKH